VTPEEFQAEAWAIHCRHRQAVTVLGDLEWSTLALCGEVGELANEIKKIRRDDRCDCSKRHTRCVSELADVFTYLSVIAEQLDITLPELIDVAADQMRAWDHSREVGR
jgi:NTP pyrophosphatase (non-canonical NTP hydrolase)